MRSFLRGCWWILVGLYRDGTIPVIALSLAIDRLLRLVLPTRVTEPWLEIACVALAFGLGWLTWKAIGELVVLWRVRSYLVGALRGRRVMRAMRCLEREVECAVTDGKRREALEAYVVAAKCHGLTGDWPPPKGMPGWMLYTSRCLYLRRRVQLEALRGHLGLRDELRRTLWEACGLLLGEEGVTNASGTTYPLMFLHAGAGKPSMN